MNRMNRRVGWACKRSILLATTAGMALAATSALAQTASEPQGLEEVVVTATRQTDTVNRVPLSIAAVSQATLDEQGIKVASDLTRTVPGLTVPSNATNTGVATFGIRGIIATVGAATTGVYLDDTSLTKRSNTGIFQQNGAPLPVLFDLQRVEVLKGPQGTLYGGSSQGGTIRFITPEPSLTTTSGSLRIEGSKIKGGEEGYDVGAAVGGPIVEDKLGFRISALRRKTPGYIDAYSPYDGGLLVKDGNGRIENAFRAAVKWQINDRGSATFAIYNTQGKTEGGPNGVTTIYAPNGTPAPAGQTFTTPVVFIDTQTRTRPAAFNAAGAAIGGRPAVTPAPTGVSVTPVACSTPALNLPNGIPTTDPACFRRPSFTYGPFRQLDKDDNLVIVGQGRQKGNGVENKFLLSSFTLDYAFDHMNVKSISSYIQDTNASGNTGGSIDQGTQQRTLEDPAHPSFPLWAGTAGDYTGGFRSKNRRYGWQQEVRFSSNADQRPLTWVAGVYYANSRTNIFYHYDGDSTPSYLSFWGIDATVRYGLAPQGPGQQAALLALIRDTELAAFGDATYWLTDKLRVTAGIRFSRVSLDYDQLNYGQFSARRATDAASITRGASTDSPKTPKIGLTYEFTSNDLVYVSAAKGFRAGGVNPQLSQATCDVGLTQAGITASEVPVSFGPDSVWSYEAGGKFRLLNNRMQINGAVYRIDWSGIQATIPLSCGFNFVMNGGKARSEGFDLQMQFKPINALTLTMNAAYTNARYIDQVAGPKPGANVPISINAGDGFSIPPWQVSLSAQYERQVTDRVNGYLRLDYQWQSDYNNGFSYGTSSFNPFTYRADSQDLVNARIGVRFEDIDINIFANNLLNSRDRVGNAGNGKNACSNAAATRNPQCTTYTNYNPFVTQSYQRPRVIGAQASYRF